VKAVFNIKGNNVKNKNDDLAIKCWCCGKIGHTLRACPHKKPRVVNMTTKHFGNTNKIANKLGTNHVILDNGENVSIFRPEHLKNIRALAAPQVSTGFQGSQLICHACGDLPVFFCVDMSTVLQSNKTSYHSLKSNPCIQSITNAVDSSWNHRMAISCLSVTSLIYSLVISRFGQRSLSTGLKRNTC